MRNSFTSHFGVETKAKRKKQARRALRAEISRGEENAAGLAALKGGALSGAAGRSGPGFGQKLKKRRGRPRIEGRLREPNGRLSRAQNPAALLAIQARAFHTGLSLEQAKDPRAATYLGRLAIFGRGDGLSADQYEAAQSFLALRNDYRRSLLSPGAYYEATGIRLGEDNMAEYAAWVKRVKKRYAQALKAIQEAQLDNGHENIYAALQYVIIDGQELPYMLGAVRLALNALHRHFSRSDDKRQGKRSWLERHSIGLAGFTADKNLH